MTLEIGHLALALLALCGGMIGAYTAIKENIATLTAKDEAQEVAISDLHALAVRSHTRLDDHLRDWHKGKEV